MATFHVIYDPTDLLQMPPHDRLTQRPFKDMRFVVLKRDDPETNEQIAALAQELATLLLKQL